MSRVYGAKIEIDPDKVREFFDHRAEKETNAVNAVMLQSQGSTIAVDRDVHERENLLPRPQKQGARILDIGCGAGRLGLHYGGQGPTYLGLDFSEKLVEPGREACAAAGDIHLMVAEMPKVAVAELPIAPPFDLVIITGLFIYMNDADVGRTLDFIPEVAADDCELYIRESIAEIEERLSLKDFHSSELNENYNAIYRTRGELKAEFEKTLLPAGFVMTDEGYAFPPHLRNRAETTQYYFKFSRKS